MSDEKSNGSLKYKFFQQRHPDYNEDYWSRCRVFYKGGQALLENDSMMNRVFPRHRNEALSIYELRKSRAHYTNYAGEIIDELIAKLNSDPLRLECKDDTEFYENFMNNCAPPGAKPYRFGDLLQNVLLTAMQCGRGWVLADMPPADPMNAAVSLAEQEMSGALNAWCVEVQPESVIDWEVDENGVLTWALLCYKSQKRDGIAGDRGMIKECYIYYTAKTWAKWEVVYKKDKPPKEEDDIQLVDGGYHNFKRVPLMQMDLPDGLWAMGKLESLAREHFNKRCALSWAEFRALFPVLYEFHDNSPENQAFGGEGGDIDRAHTQGRSAGHMQVRNSGDRVEWASPPSESFTHALESCSSIRDEMHRVVHQMARSADMNKAAIRRSGESKAQDENATNIVLEALGDLIREYAKNLIVMIGNGRGDKDLDWLATGLSSFQQGTLSSLLEQEALLDATIEIPSSTFKKTRKFLIAKKILGDAIREKDLEIIKKEIEGAYSQEEELNKLMLGGETGGSFDPEPAPSVVRPSVPGSSKGKEE